MQLFLTSFFARVARAFPMFSQGRHVGKTVTFIPTASLHDKLSFHIKADRRALKRLGMVLNELEISTASSDEIESRISQTDYLFVDGGNTFFLLQELRRTHADALITAHIGQGKPYIGASAGSIILSGNIEYARLMDNPKAAPGLHGDFSALSVVDFNIVPHYGSTPFIRATTNMMTQYSPSLNLCPIRNNEALIVQNDKARIVTAGKRLASMRSACGPSRHN